MGLSFWVPPLLWMAVILGLSSDLFGGAATRSLLLPVLRWLLPWATDLQLDLAHQAIRKLAHSTEYAVLALLWYRTLRAGRALPPVRSAWLAALIAVAWAGADEARQTLTATRGGSVGDVALDALGAGVALAAVVLGRGGLRFATGLLLWMAAVGGVFFLALHAWLGLGSGWLWATTPAAWLALWWHRRGRPVG